MAIVLTLCVHEKCPAELEDITNVAGKTSTKESTQYIKNELTYIVTEI